MSDHPNDPFDDLMRQALHEEADRIEPADALPEIRARAHAQRRPAARRPWLMTVGAAAIGTAAAIGAFTVYNGTQNTANDGDTVAGPGTTPTASDLPSTMASPVPSPIPSEATQPPTTMPEATTVAPTGRGKPEPYVKSTVVPVYWLGNRVGAQTKSEVRLYRTWAKVQGRPAVEAVRIMTSKQSDDPDYYSAWTGAQVSSVTRAADDLVTVDFKQLPQARLDPDSAQVAAQQLVYTVQGAMESGTADRVQVTQQGQTGDKLFGQVDTSRPLSRAKADDVQALIWITSPDNRALLKTPFKVTGVGSAFEAQLNWHIVSDKTRKVVAKGATNTREAFKFTPFAFDVTKLPPGPYTLEVFEISAADGSITSTDSKTLIVR